MCVIWSNSRYLTLDEANEWYRNGNGQPLYVSLEKINLDGLVSLGEDYVGKKYTFNLLYGASLKAADGAAITIDYFEKPT